MRPISFDIVTTTCRLCYHQPRFAAAPLCIPGGPVSTFRCCSRDSDTKRVMLDGVYISCARQDPEKIRVYLEGHKIIGDVAPKPHPCTAGGLVVTASAGTYSSRALATAKHAVQYARGTVIYCNPNAGLLEGVEEDHSWVNFYTSLGACDNPHWGFHRSNCTQRNRAICIRIPETPRVRRAAIQLPGVRT